MTYRVTDDPAASKLLSERLLAALEREIALVEMGCKVNNPRKPQPGSRTADVEPAAAGGSASSGKPARRMVAGGGKERIEAIGQLTRTLEKLLELKRLERLAVEGGEEAGDAEAERLRAEMMKRLQALDAKRRGGPSLFGTDAADAASGAPSFGPVAG